ncbi:MAG: ribosome biosis GTPase / thiamine phosphate phosphatase, partial [Actinomycetota bacterium]|nr:ribosome biosis GTPase / thiamine phosphate phosphatase [Actinomycetota bacterium]
HRGRHTTTSRQLVAVPGGGVLIDTPGLRALSLSGGEGLSNAFRDIEHFAEGCRFSDCEHQHEPACAVLAAVDSGELDPNRLSSYRKLQKELAFEARKNDPLARAEEERIWKIRSRAGKRIRRERGR